MSFRLSILLEVVFCKNIDINAFHLSSIVIRHLLVNPRDRRVVIIESILCPSHFRETLTKVFFKQFEVSKPNWSSPDSVYTSCWTAGVLLWRFRKCMGWNWACSPSVMSPSVGSSGNCTRSGHRVWPTSKYCSLKLRIIHFLPLPVSWVVLLKHCSHQLAEVCVCLPPCVLTERCDICQVPSVLFAPSHLMAIMSLGINSALVMDCGYTETLVLPVSFGCRQWWHFLSFGKITLIM